MKQKLGAPKSTYRHNALIGKYHTILASKKKIRFWPSTHIIDEANFVTIASNSWQAEVIARSTSYQTLWTDKNLARNHSATKLVFKWMVIPSIALMLLSKMTVPFFSGRNFFRWFKKHSRPDDCTSVVIFSGCNWCLYFDTNTNYGTYTRKKLLPEKKVLSSGQLFFSADSNYNQKKLRLEKKVQSSGRRLK